VSFNNSIALLFVLLLISCVQPTKVLKKQSRFYIHLSIENAEGKKVVLLKTTPTIIAIDSSMTEDNSVVFEGSFLTPERYLLKINGIDGTKLFIIDNDSIQITINKKDIVKSTITSSPINDELNHFQNKSKQITSKIEFLFPEIQRARLDNDAKKLAEISTKITNITQENIDYSFDYIQNNPSSFISAMILNDLSKKSTVDINRISKSYQLLSDKVKESADAKEVLLFLNTSF